MERKERKSTLMLRIEQEQGKALPDLLRERHQALGNYTSVAEELGVPAATVYYWFRKFNVPLNQYMVPSGPQEAA